MAELTQDQKRALHVLAYMMFRMGQEDRAEHIYAALAALAPKDKVDRLALAGLAAVAVHQGKGKLALEYLRSAMSGTVLSSRQTALYLLKAQALWLEGREQEARTARDEYLFLAGKSGKEPIV